MYIRETSHFGEEIAMDEANNFEQVEGRQCSMSAMAYGGEGESVPLSALSVSALTHRYVSASTNEQMRSA